MLGKSTRLRPALSLSDIYGTRTIYNPRCSYERYGWLSTDPLVHARTTGSALTVAGSMPTICATSALTEASERLYAAAGLGDLPEVYPFANRCEYERLLGWAGDAQQKLVFQQIHPPGAVRDELYWVNRSLLAALNSKANLANVVPREFVVPRTILTCDELQSFMEQNQTYPLVIKNGDSGVGGSGVAVAMLRRFEDWAAVQTKLSGAQRFVVEQFIHARDNFCLNFFTHGKHSVFLGSSKQLTDSEGAYLGNWYDPAVTPPSAAIDVGHAIMAAAMEMGYSGVAGFDMLVDQQDRLWVIDLNFRLNGSTPALMWLDVLRSADVGCRQAKSLSVVTTTDLDRKMNRLEELVQLKAFFPLTVIAENDSADHAPRLGIRGLVLGQSHQEVMDLDQLINELLADREPSMPEPVVAYARVSGQVAGLRIPALIEQPPAPVLPTLH